MLYSIIKIKKQSGIALVIVLWMLALLIILAMGYSRMVRIETSLTANLVHYSQAKAIAEAGVWQAIAELLKPKIDQQWRTDGTAYSLTFEQGSIDLTIVDETGKIDINTGHSELLFGLINSVGLPEEESLRLSQAILDWRDKDNLVRNYGAEDDDYRQANFQYGAKDGPFNSLSELQLVMGMTPKIYNELKSTLTIYSNQSGINPDSASKSALLSIPGATEAQVDIFLQTRAEYQDIDTSTPFIGINSKYLSKVSGKIFSISSRGIIDNTSANLEVIVSMKKYLNKPYAILSWQESSGREISDELDSEANES